MIKMSKFLESLRKARKLKNVERNEKNKEFSRELLKAENEIAKALREIQYKMLFGEFYYKKTQKY